MKGKLVNGMGSQYSSHYFGTWCIQHTVTHGRGREGETGELEWVASTLHTTSEHGVSSITTADAHISAASSRKDTPPI